jgi:hypothetical protein
MATNDLARLEAERVHREQFYKALDAISAEELLKEEKDRKASRYYPKEENAKIIKEIEEAEILKSKKSNRQYYLLKKYELLLIGETKRIIKRLTNDSEDIKQLVPYEGLFDALLKCHTTIGHKGRDAMLNECAKQHINLTTDIINSNYK